MSASGDRAGRRGRPSSMDWPDRHVEESSSSSKPSTLDAGEQAISVNFRAFRIYTVRVCMARRLRGTSHRRVRLSHLTTIIVCPRCVNRRREQDEHRGCSLEPQLHRAPFTGAPPRAYRRTSCPSPRPTIARLRASIPARGIVSSFPPTAPQRQAATRLTRRAPRRGRLPSRL